MKIPFFRNKHKEAQTRVWNAYANMLEQRSFNAADVTRLVSEWRYDAGFTNSDILGALSSIRSRSRDMAKNSPLYARFIQLMRENIVGDGFRFKALPFLAGSDDAEHLDPEAAKFLEYHWWRWSKNPYYVDSAKRQNLTQFLSLVVENWVRDGEAFVIIDQAAQNRYGLSLRLIRADCIDEAMNIRKDERVTVRGGIEYDVGTGAPLAYYFNGNNTDPAGTIYVEGKPRVRIPARFVIHLFERHDADQIRGIPLGYSALLPMKMLDEYTKAELVAAKDEACTIGTFSCPAGQDGPMQMTTDAANDTRQKIEAGQKVYLPEGWKYDALTPQHPNRGWQDFSVGLQRLIATGLGVDFAELTGNGSDTISAVARQSMLRTREMYKDRQRTVQSLVLDRIWYAWLHSFLRLRVSGKFSDADFDRLSDHEFQGRRWGWIDPSAEINAAAVAVAHGWRTDADVCSEIGGGDIDDNITEQLRVKDAKAAAGLITVGQGLNAAPPSEPKKDGDDGKKDDGENTEVDAAPIVKKPKKKSKKKED